MLRALALASALAMADGTMVAAQERPSLLPVSLDRVREGLERPPAINLDVSGHVAVARFKTSVDERLYLLPFKDHFDKQFTLTPLQQQSAEWGSKCCGLDLGALARPVRRALRRREEGRIRERVARELAAVQAAASQRRK